MKKLSTLFLLVLCTALVAEAQLRQDLNYHPEEYTTSLTHTKTPSSGSWMNMLNMTMSHSYSMSFANFGGQTQNLNAYTNSMFFDVSDRIDAQLDVSLLHSPFGNSFMNTNNSLGTQIVIDQARIDFKPSENTRISLQFSQNPYNSAFGPYGYGNNYYSPFNRRSPWY
jgi:hypothetical protein